MIVLVDDEKDIADIFTKFLQRSGFKVSGFTNPVQALDFFTANYKNCSLIITDLRMPQMNGIEFASRVRAISQDVKMLLMTAFETTSYSEEIENLGFSGVLHKPVMPASMKTVVDKTLGVEQP